MTLYHTTPCYTTSSTCISSETPKNENPKNDPKSSTPPTPGPRQKPLPQQNQVVPTPFDTSRPTVTRRGRLALQQGHGDDGRVAGEELRSAEERHEEPEPGRWRCKARRRRWQVFRWMEGGMDVELRERMEKVRRMEAWQLQGLFLGRSF